jgi:putative transposase
VARPLRIEYKNAYYHVMNRGRGRQYIFHNDEYYEAFLDCLEQANVRFGLEIHAYCLMGNHYHLLVKTPRGNLGRAMRHINGVYTQRYNWLKKTDGPLFRGRYKAILINAASYLLQVSRYIHRNPIELKTPLVAELIDYKWSSYPAYLNKASIFPWLVQSDIFDELGTSKPVSAYRRYVGQGIDEETRDFYAKDRWSAIRGDNKFIKKARKNQLCYSKEVSQGRQQEVISLKMISKTVAGFYDCEEKSILHARRGRGEKNLPRWIAMKMSQDLSGLNLETIARHFNVGNYCTVSRTIGRLREEMEWDRNILGDLNSISKDLTP